MRRLKSMMLVLVLIIIMMQIIEAVTNDDINSNTNIITASIDKNNDNSNHSLQSLMLSYNFSSNPCFLHISNTTHTFTNTVASSLNQCPIHVRYQHKVWPYRHCFRIQYPIRRKEDACDHELITQVSDYVGNVGIVSYPIHFQSPALKDGTFVFISDAKASYPNKYIAAFDMVIADISIYAETRRNRSILYDMSYVPFIVYSQSIHQENRKFDATLTKNVSILISRLLYRGYILNLPFTTMISAFNAGLRKSMALSISQTYIASSVSALRQIRILVVRSEKEEHSGYWPFFSDNHMAKRPQCRRGDDVALFDRLFPFLALADYNQFSFDYFNYEANFSSQVHPNRIDLDEYCHCDGNAIRSRVCLSYERSRKLSISSLVSSENQSDSILGHFLDDFEHMLTAAWIFSANELKSGAWYQRATTEDFDGENVKSKLQNEISIALRLIDFFKGYDVIFYDAVSWALPAEISLLVNLIWLARTPKLIRYVSADDGYFDQFMNWLPSDAVLTDSRSYENEAWFGVTVATPLPSNRIPILAVPPFLPLNSFDDFNYVSNYDDELESQWWKDLLAAKLNNTIIVGFLGFASNSHSPGAFLRIAARIHQLCQNKNTSIGSTCDANQFASRDCTSSCPLRPIQFVMLDHGYLRSSMRSLVQLLDLSSVVTFISSNPIFGLQPFSTRTIERVMSICSVLVDPSPTHAGHAALFPSAAALRIPILRFNSSNANEWLVEGQAIAVASINIEMLATTCIQILNDQVTDSATTKHPALGAFNAFAISELVEVFVVSVVEAPKHWELHSSQPIDRLQPVLSVELSAATIDQVMNEMSLTFDETSWNRAWHQRAPYALDLHLLSLDQALLDRCNFWDWYDVLQSMTPRLNLQLAGHPPSVPSAGPEGFRLLCIIFTIQSRHHRVRGQLRTWGKRCDGFIAFSNVDDSDINAIKLDMSTQGGDLYSNMWRKVVIIWSFISKHFGVNSLLSKSNNYDWFLIGGDDIYVSLPQMREYLYSVSKIYRNAPLYLGRRLLRGVDVFYNGGGAGYLLNQEALQVLIQQLAKPGACYQSSQVAMEDIIVALCLAQAGVHPLDTRETRLVNNTLLGVERFHWYPPNVEFEAKLPVYRRHAAHRPILDEDNCCSTQSVTWHSLSPEEMQCADLLLSSLVTSR